MTPTSSAGTPVFVGTRVPVRTPLESLAAGDTLEELLDHFPTSAFDKASPISTGPAGKTRTARRASNGPMTPTRQQLEQCDRDHVWHPLTPMQECAAEPPLIVVDADGCFRIDLDGNRYLDGTASLWCNVHGHRVAGRATGRPDRRERRSVGGPATSSVRRRVAIGEDPP